MALTLGDNFSYQGAKPLDARLKYETVAAMKAVADATMYDGCLAYCAGTDKTYQWKSGNTVDETTGRWREFNSGGGETYTAGDGIDISAENEISTEKSEAGWMDEVIEKVPMSGALVNIANAFNRSDLYSTTERVVGQWIDGKPLYQKTIYLGNFPNNAVVDVNHGITNIDQIVSIEGFLKYDDQNFYPLTHFNNVGGTYYLSGIWLTKTLIKLATNWNASAYDGYAILKYTKTTDSAIAIGSETEYSTDEKIVGSWIDGKPLYQKTIEFTVPTTYDSDVTIYTGNTNERIKYAWGALVTSIEDSITLDSPYSGTLRTALHWNKNVLTFRTNEWGGSNAYVTIQYTKTT